MKYIKNGLKLVLIIFLFSCNESSHKEADQIAVSSGLEKDEADNRKNVPNSKKKAIVAFGDQTYQLDQVVCIPGAMASAVAYDSQDRSNYPVVNIKTFSEPFGGAAANTVSVQIEAPEGKQHWRLHDGEVAKEDKTFSATGTLKGVVMEELPNGNLKPIPLEGDDIKPFSIKVQCG